MKPAPRAGREQSGTTTPYPVSLKSESLGGEKGSKFTSVRERRCPEFLNRP